MKVRSLVAAALMVTAAGGAMAADQLVSFNGDTASFIGTAPLLQGGDDVISFDNLAGGTYDFLLTLSGQYIHLDSLTLNGVAGTVYSNNKLLFAGVEGTGSTPFALTLTGFTTNDKANYSGELSVVAVPEPETYALMLGGLAAVGFMARRRRG